MYSGSNTFMFAHYQPWFYQGNTKKIATGYNSNNTYTVAQQINDMTARGFKGVVIDWYGQYGGDQSGYDDGTTLKIQSNLTPKCGRDDLSLLLRADGGQGSAVVLYRDECMPAFACS